MGRAVGSLGRSGRGKCAGPVSGRKSCHVNRRELLAGAFAFPLMGGREPIVSPGGGALASTVDEPLQNPLALSAGMLAQGNYLGALLRLKELAPRYLSSAFRQTYLDTLPQLYSYVGDDRGLYEAEARLLAHLRTIPNGPSREVTDLASSPLDACGPTRALDVIASAAESHQVIMTNEEHRTPVHRAYVLQLLPMLRHKGFRYLALEALHESEAALAARGYPTHASGSYLNDPVFGDMVRSALRLGFKVVPYEHRERCEMRPDNPLFCQDERERGQARNLTRILAADPGAKMLVHVGRGHNAKWQSRGFAMMGFHFRQLSGIDPYSVDQLQSERLLRADESALYRYVLRNWRISMPSVFTCPGGSFWGGEEGRGYDLTIFHPRAQMLEGRPAWLRMGRYRRPVRIDARRLELPVGNGRYRGAEPLLIQALLRIEGPDAIPVDQIMVERGSRLPILLLPAGDYRIRLVDRLNRQVAQYPTAVP